MGVDVVGVQHAGGRGVHLAPLTPSALHNAAQRQANHSDLNPARLYQVVAIQSASKLVGVC